MPYIPYIPYLPYLPYIATYHTFQTCRTRPTIHTIHTVISNIPYPTYLHTTPTIHTIPTIRAIHTIPAIHTKHTIHSKHTIHTIPTIHATHTIHIKHSVHATITYHTHNTHHAIYIVLHTLHPPAPHTRGGGQYYGWPMTMARGGLERWYIYIIIYIHIYIYVCMEYTRMCHWVTYPMERMLGFHLRCPCPGAGSTSCAATQPRRSGKSLDARTGQTLFWFKTSFHIYITYSIILYYNIPSIISQCLPRTGNLNPKSSVFFQKPGLITQHF